MKRNRNQVQITAKSQRAVTKGCVNIPIHEHVACISPALCRTSEHSGAEPGWGTDMKWADGICFVSMRGTSPEKAPLTGGNAGLPRGWGGSSKRVFLCDRWRYETMPTKSQRTWRGWSTWCDFFHWTRGYWRALLCYLKKWTMKLIFKRWKIWWNIGKYGGW